MTLHFDQCNETDREIGNPLQFRMIDLFAVLTLCALILAMLAPFLRQMQSGHRLQMVAVFAGQAIVIALAILRSANMRKKMLQVSGRRIGIGFCGEVKWRHWPLARSLATILLFAIVQVLFAVATVKMMGMSPVFLLQQFQLAFFFGFGYSRYIWRVYPNSLEFYEYGVGTDGVNLVPWDRVSVRDSQFFLDRIVVVTHATPGSVDANMHVVQVSKHLRHKIDGARANIPS